MQLKRDTDYALRILTCAAERKKNKRTFSGGLTLQDLSMYTGMPRVSVDRICRCLEKKKLLIKATGVKNETVYFATERSDELSLLDIIAAVEQETDLFAVFDKKSDMYRTQEEKFSDIQHRMEEYLSQIKVNDFLKTGIFGVRR